MGKMLAGMGKMLVALTATASREGRPVVCSVHKGAHVLYKGLK